MRTITLAEVARRLGISESTAKKIAPQLPGAIKISKRTRYFEEAVADFIERGGIAESAGKHKPTAT